MTDHNDDRVDANYLAHKRCRGCGEPFAAVELNSDNHCASCVAVDERINKHKQKGHINADRKYGVDD